MRKQPMGKDRADHSLGITAVSIRGFKSHVTENRIDIRQLTILAERTAPENQVLSSRCC